MAIQLQLRKGTKVQNDAFTGAEGELTYDTDSKGLRVHDGQTPGGHMIDTVVAWQVPTAENNYTWYRKYASGWVEQGGSFTGVSGTITLPVVMADINYTLLMLPHLNDNQSIQYYQAGHTKTTTGFSYNSANNRQFDWRAEGMAA